MSFAQINKFFTLLFFVAACATTPSAFAQNFKCKDASGKVSYQDTPCGAGQQGSRIMIPKEPVLTEEERFNAGAYWSGLTPAEARQRLLEADQTASQEHADQARQASKTEQESRAADCNYRYDKLAKDVSDERRRLELERDRTACIQGSDPSDVSKIDQEHRAADCNFRYDKLAKEISEDRRRLELERDRTACIQGISPGGYIPNAPYSAPDNRNAQRGQCAGSCESSQGICIGQCQGNDICMSNCNASRDRCIAACSSNF